MTPGMTIKLLRHAQELTQGDLARELDVTRPYLSQVERGRKTPSLAFLRRAAETLRVPVALLVTNPDEPESEVFGELRRILADLLEAKMSATGLKPR